MRQTSRLPLYLTQFYSGIVWVTLGPLLNSILSELDIPLARGGLPALGFNLGTVLGLLVINFLLARVPAKTILVGAACVETVALAASGLLTGGLWSFTIAYLIAGLACVMLAAVPGMWISANVKEGTARAMILVMLGSVSSMAITPLILGVLIGAGAHWRWIYSCEAGLAAILALGVASLPLADIPDRENLRLRQLKEVVAFNPALLAAIVAASFMYLGAELTLVVWLPKFQTDVFGATATWAGLSVTLYWVGQIVARLVSVGLTRRFRSSSLLLAGSVVMAVFAGVLAVSPTQALFLVFTLGAGLGSSACFSYIASYAGRFPGWHAGVVYSAFQLAGGVGAMVFPYITGPLAAAVGFRAAIAVAAAPAFLVAVLAIALRRTSGEGSVEVERVPA